MGWYWIGPSWTGEKGKESKKDLDEYILNEGDSLYTFFIVECSVNGNGFQINPTTGKKLKPEETIKDPLYDTMEKKLLYLRDNDIEFTSGVLDNAEQTQYISFSIEGNTYTYKAPNHWDQRIKELNQVNKYFNIY